MIYNVYCDESCHLENDPYRVMVLGAIWCLKDRARIIFEEIRKIKQKHGLPSQFEVKWGKVSPAKIVFYSELVNYFFHNQFLHFRGLVVPDKSILDHSAFGQTHDEWYYKMYFELLKTIFHQDFSPNSIFYVYIDIKDTRSGERIQKLHEVLCHSQHDFDREVIRRIQPVNSREVELQQLTDLMTGAIGYANRGLQTSAAKSYLVELIRLKSRYALTQNTPFQEHKFNLLVWHPNPGGLE